MQRGGLLASRPTTLKLSNNTTHSECRVLRSGGLNHSNHYAL
jgi:hypothetical protein